MVSSSRRVGILAFDAMELLDYAGPYEVFDVAAESTGGKAFTVTSIGVRPGHVVARGGFTVVPDQALADAELPDVLGAAGLLAGRPATTHHTAFDDLAEVEPTATVVTDQRYVRSADNIWTSAGVSAGIDLSLRLVEELVGADVRDLVVTEMEWRGRA